MSVGGVDIAYYSICKRKLWLYNKGITMEDESERVGQGKVLHESAYPRLTQREILIDNSFKIDAIDGEYVREIKLSSKMKKTDEWQMLFYLYQMKIRGIEKKGLISYTKEKQTFEVELTKEKEKQLKQMIAEVYKTLEQEFAPAVRKLPYCKSCAYFGFCYTKEADEYDT